MKNRRSLRLKDYDYAEAGAYFVTVCTQGRRFVFGDIHHGVILLNDAGKMIYDMWCELIDRFSNIKLDEYVVMPNHMHGIIYIVGAPLVGAPTGTGNAVRAGTRPAPTLGSIIGAFKSITTNKYIENIHGNKWPKFYGKLWQRNYFERVIRDERELNAMREYILNNPAQWAFDSENPKNFPHS